MVMNRCASHRYSSSVRGVLVGLLFLLSPLTLSQAQVVTNITPSALPHCPGPCGLGVTIVTPPHRRDSHDDHWRGQAGERTESVPQLRTVQRRDRKCCELLQ